MAWSRCPVCGEEFSGDYLGDRHRTGDHNDGSRRCLTPTEMVAKGWHVDRYGRWRRAPK